MENLQTLLCSVETGENVIKATVCLHNFLKTEIADQYCPSTLTDTILDNSDFVEGSWRQATQNDQSLTPVGRIGSNRSSKEAYEQRDRIADYLVSSEGSVPWQIKYINRGK